MEDYVRIFDTTLRDGEQSPGATLTSAEKLYVARGLARLGVDIIEAGFPAASPDDLEAVRAIAREVGRGPKAPVICGLARAAKTDIDLAWEAVREAERPRLHTFLAVSAIHMKYKLRLDPEQVIERAAAMVAYARSRCADVEFSPEDAGRADPEFLHVVLAEAIRAGATTVNIPDTVGYTTPDEFGALIAGIRRNVPGIENVVISVHCHDDLGMATANTLAGLRAGARQAEVTVNGIGERAGNTSLEEVVMALQTRKPIFGLNTGIDTTQLMRLSRLVSSHTGIPVQPNKAIVGANAFAHEAGIHQDGMLKNHQTYEIMRPESVGVARSQLVLGKHSGRHALKAQLNELGYNIADAELDQVFIRFKDLADRKKTITDADLEALVSDEFRAARDRFTLDALQVTCGTIGLATATVRLRAPDGALYTRAATGTGPVDATYKAIDAVLQIAGTLVEFNIKAVTRGIDALGEVTVRFEAAEGGHSLNAQTENELPRVFGGHGADTDIVVASAKAYLGALNKVLAARRTEPAAAAAVPDGPDGLARFGVMLTA